MEKYRDGQRELHCVFVDLEKAYDRVPREELWYCMRKSGVAEKYVRVVQDMYERSRTVVRCAVGQTEEFKVEVGLHQGSALSPFLFAIVMDQLSEEVRQESPWTMMFADDIVICSESREQVEENLERWRFALERRGMKVSRSKTEYMCVNEREGSGKVRLQGEEVKKVEEFKYLGSTVQSNGECGKEGKVYRTVVRPAMLYGLETVSLKKTQESELEVAELKMLRFSLGVTRLDRIRNEYIRGTAHVGRLGDKVREARLRWFGHVQRREINYTYFLRMVNADASMADELNTFYARFEAAAHSANGVSSANCAIGSTHTENAGHVNTLVKKARQRLYHLRRLKDFKLPSKVLKIFYTCTIESILMGSITAWFGNSTKQDRQALQRYKRHLSTTSNSQTPNSTMAKTKELSKGTRNKIVGLHQAGKTESAIGAHVAISAKLDEDIMLSASDSKELDVGNKEQTGFELHIAFCGV
ncbi:hypothetical protein QTP86_017160 [Hemibagrus guttatus]|nr:hypothetical protein QTP86_017160 [Hemibagrus guttatus]